MGVIIEELIHKFNEKNNEEAREHFTPRHFVSLIADVIFMPIKDKIKNSTYLCYDGASGTGGMFAIAEESLYKFAKENYEAVAIHFYGQKSQPENYTIARVDLLITGGYSQADNTFYDPTLVTIILLLK